MALFVGELAFGDGRLMETAKVGILSGSLLAAGARGAVLVRALPPAPRGD
jgi:Na+/H+ antiporter NhaA